jgi:hypothetical protein
MRRLVTALLVLAPLAGGCKDVRSMRHSRDVAGLSEALRDPDPQTRVKAVDALGQVGDEAAIDALLRALDDEDPYVREHAARCLGCNYHSSLGTAQHRASLCPSSWSSETSLQD